MTKKIRLFRIVICILLGITMLWTAFISYAFIYVTKENEANKKNERYGIYVAGVDVTHGNAYDILGDGTVYYNEVSNKLVLDNATIECDGSAIYSEIDVTVELIGENKFICKGKELTYGIYASNRSLQKDLVISGDGSLEILVEDEGCRGNAGIIADDLWIRADVSINLASATESTTGISCDYLNLGEGKALNVQVGSAENNTGIAVRGSMYLAEDSVMNTVCATATEESYGIECSGKITTEKNATIHAESGSDNAGIVCYSVFLDYGAYIYAEIDAVDGIRDMKRY